MKQHIIEKIKELAKNGSPPGKQVFRKHTGISEYEILKHWDRWSEAVIDAGFKPNEKQKAIPKKEIIKKMILLIRENNKFPSEAVIRRKKRNDPSFPSHGAIGKLGSKAHLVSEIIEFCHGKEEYQDIVDICSKIKNKPKHSNDKATSVIGYVYLIEFGDYYKIGRSNDIERRFREITTKLPEEGIMIHSIETDDPEGIEGYWHKRFKEKRTRGEWFKLDLSDIKVFKKRKFM